MISMEQMALVLNALPDPAFILSRSGKYVAIFGGRDERYYHDGSGLVGLYVADVVTDEKTRWFIEQIESALQSRTLLIQEYELSSKDVKGLADDGPEKPIWFEGRIQALDFLVDGEEVVLWVASNITQRHDSEIKLREISDTDQLTGLFNRRKLEYELALHYASFKRHSLPMSIFIFDLDHLKKINDVQGHNAGDDVILAIADICRVALRETDIACRFGGDEFVVVLPNTGMQDALQFAQRFRECANQALSCFAIDGVSVTVSIGVSVTLSADSSYEDALKRADEALYEAKRQGRNQVCAALLVS